MQHVPMSELPGFGLLMLNRHRGTDFEFMGATERWGG